MIVEIHASPNPEFTKVLGKKVKDVGGKYSEARGHSDTRFVTLSLKDKDLIEEVVARFGSYKKTTVILRIGRQSEVVYVPTGENVFSVIGQGVVELLIAHKAEVQSSIMHASERVTKEFEQLSIEKIKAAALYDFDPSKVEQFKDFLDKAKSQVAASVKAFNENLEVAHERLDFAKNVLQELKNSPEYAPYWATVEA